MTADRVIRYSTVTAVAAVGLAAAVLSYRHQLELAAGHGESALTAKLIPISIDGLLLAGTLAVLDASRRQTGHAWAARVTVGLGVAMTMWVNIVHGLGFGWAGITISGWPPVALMAAIEVLARMVRPSAPEAGTPAPEPPAGLNGHAGRAAELFADDLAAGQVPGVRRIRKEMQTSTDTTGQPQADLAADAGQRWTTDEMQRDFEVLGFAAPFVVVSRRSDGKTGTLEFTHSPRTYFSFEEAS